jgi:MFS family permease
MIMPTGFAPQALLDGSFNSEGYRISPEDLGVINSASSITMLLGTPLFAMIIASEWNFGAFASIFYGLLSFSAMTFATAFCKTVWQFMIVKLIQGLGTAAANVAIITFLVKNVEDLSAVMAFERVIFGISLFFGITTGGPLYAAVGYRGVYFIAAGLAFLATCIFSGFLFMNYSSWRRFDCNGKDAIDENSKVDIPWKAKIRLFFGADIVVVSLCCLQLFWVLSANNFSGLHFENSLHVPRSAVGWIFSTFTILYSLAALSGPLLERRIGAKYVMTLGLLLIGIGFVMLGPMPYLDSLITNSAGAWAITISSMACYGTGIAYGAVQVTPLLTRFTTARLESMVNGGVDGLEGLSAEKQRVFVSSFVSGMFNILVSLPSIVGPIIGGYIYANVPQRFEVNCISRIEDGVDVCVSGFQWLTFIIALTSFFMFLFAFIFLRSSPSTPVSSKSSDIEQEDP